jgi:CBS domain-containing protein
MLEGMPKEPREEMIVALAGPAVNLVIAAGLFLILLMLGSDRFFSGFDLAGSGLLQSLLAANLMLAVFNMLPAFPMDGGRVLRAALSMRTDRVRATRLAARIGQILAIGLGFLGLVGNPFLILIAVFVWIGAGAEAGAAEEDARLSGRPAELAMITDFQVVHPGDPLGRAIDLTLTGTQKDFPVVEDGTVVGVLSQSGLLRGLRDLGADGRVAQTMEPARTAEVGTPLDRLLPALQDGTRLVCITRNGALAGIVDLENIIEYLRIQTALSER